MPEPKGRTKRPARPAAYESAYGSAYEAAQLAARAKAGALTTAAARRVQQAIDEYARRLADQIARLPATTPIVVRQSIVAALEIARRESTDLGDEITDAISSNRALAFREVLDVWQRTSEAVVAAENIPTALMGGIATPKLLMAARYDALGGVSYLKSLTASAKAGGEEAAALIRTALVSNVSPPELARRLRPYVAGAEEFEAMFPKRDARFKALYEFRDKTLPAELRNAAFKVRSNSLRIAYSEIHNARAEATLQAFAVDPLIYAVRWTLSPNRGSQGSPDVCDGLAQNDWYGLGVGVYPLDAVPLPPHPRDRCERAPVIRAPTDWRRPKPTEMTPTLDPEDASVVGEPGMARLTADQAARVREQLGRSLTLARRSDAATAMRTLMAQGERAAAALPIGVGGPP